MASFGDPLDTEGPLFAMNQAIQVRGLDPTFWQDAQGNYDLNKPYSFVLEGVGKQMDPAFYGPNYWTIPEVGT